MKIYTSECGRLSVSLPEGLDEVTIGKLLTQSIKNNPEVLDQNNKGSNISLGVVRNPVQPKSKTNLT
jgi:hypothetical protein